MTQPADIAGSSDQYNAPAPKQKPDDSLDYGRLITDPGKAYADFIAKRMGRPSDVPSVYDKIRTPGGLLTAVNPALAPAGYFANRGYQRIPTATEADRLAQQDGSQQAPPTDLYVKRGAEQVSGGMAPSAPQEDTGDNVPALTGPGSTPKKAASSGGGGGGAPVASPLEQRLAADYNEQLGGMQEESDATDAANGAEANALRNAAGVERSEALNSRGMASATAAEARQHLDMIGGLAQDYAEGRIDKEKWWTDQSAPQQVATVVGAMFAGLGGGVKGATDFVNNMVDRSIAVQQENMKIKGRGLYEADNLFNNFLKVSGNEQEAYDKTRAAMLDSAMTEAAAAGKEAQSPIHRAQMKQFMAALKLQRDMMLAKLASARQAAAGAAQSQQAGWLAANPETIINHDGQDYIIANPQEGKAVTDALSQLKIIKGLIAQGDALVNARKGITDYLPYSANIQEGENVQKDLTEALSKLAAARGIPPSIASTIAQQLPQYGSRFAEVQLPKSKAMNEYLDRRSAEVLSGARAVPVETQVGTGKGKKAGELTYYVRPGASPRAAPAVKAQAQYPGFKPQ